MTAGRDVRVAFRSKFGAARRTVSCGRDIDFRLALFAEQQTLKPFASLVRLRF